MVTTMFPDVQPMVEACDKVKYMHGLIAEIPEVYRGISIPTRKELKGISIEDFSEMLFESYPKAAPCFNEIYKLMENNRDLFGGMTTLLELYAKPVVEMPHFDDEQQPMRRHSQFGGWEVRTAEGWVSESEYFDTLAAWMPLGR